MPLFQKHHGGCELSVEKIFLIAVRRKLLYIPFKPFTVQHFSPHGVKHRLAVHFTKHYKKQEHQPNPLNFLKSLPRADYSYLANVNFRG